MRLAVVFALFFCGSVANNCTRPEVPENGFIILDREVYQLHDFVFYFCNDGYTRSGDFIVQCTESGWSGNGTVCNIDYSKCGKRPAVFNRSPRILGGSPASNGSWPWMAIVARSTDAGLFVSCGGSVLSGRWVLTAANCFTDDEVLFVFVGRLFRSSASPNEQVHSVVRKYRHPHYSHYLFGYDVGLLELATSITFSEVVRPICLPPGTNYEIAPKAKCYFAGWGRTSDNDTSLSNQLQEVELTIEGKSDCQNEYQRFANASATLPPTVTCAGPNDKDACEGDGGGPLMCDVGDNTWYQFGVNSFGEAGCLSGPSFFAKVSEVYGWIRNVTLLKYSPPNDINECNQSPDPCNGNVCIDYVGGYDCDRAQCSRPTAPHLGSIDPDKTVYQVGETVTFACSEGSDLFGSNEIACTATGWSNTPPQCIKDYSICGKRPTAFNAQRRPRIFGGSPASNGSWPWMAIVAVSIDGGLRVGCGGSILSARWILTDAGCAGFDYTLIVFVGKLLREFFPQQQEHAVEQKFVHPNFRRSLFGNDVGLLKLATSITFNEVVRPICLPSGTNYEVAPKTKCYFAGFGRTYDNSSLPNQLQEAELTVETRSACQSEYRDFRNSSLIMPSSIMCAGPNNKDICSRDFGGPLMCDIGNDTWYQFGVGSFSEIACLTGPSFFAKVNEMYSWIRNITDKEYEPPSDENECNREPNPCGNNICVNYVGSYACGGPVRCLNPAVPDHGSVHPVKSQYANNEIISYACNAGYQLSGSATVRCTRNGWSNDGPRCNDVNECQQNIDICGNNECINNVGSYSCGSPIRCFAPVAPIEGFVTPDKTYYSINETAAYFCNAGYLLSGESEAQCTEIGWSNNGPQCNAPSVCTRPVVVITGSIIPDKFEYEIDEIITYFCNAGYQLSGPGRSQCTQDGWSHSALQCEDVDECEQTPNPCGDRKCYNFIGSYACDAISQMRMRSAFMVAVTVATSLLVYALC